MSWKPSVLSSDERARALMAGAVGLLALMPYRYLYHAGMNDEGIVINAARRMLEGQVPYRDFDLFYTPGSMIVTAAWMGTFGDSIGSARWLMVVCAGLMTALISMVSQRLLPWPWAAAPPLLFAASGYSEWPVLSYHWFAILGLLACLHQILLWVRDGGRRALLTAGIACGLAALCLQSEGVASCLAGTLTIALGRQKEPATERLRGILVFLSGIGVVWLPFALLLVFSGALKAFVDNTILAVLSGLYHSHAAPYDLDKHVLANWRNLAAQWPSQWTGPRLLWAAETLTMVSVWTLKYGGLFPVALGLSGLAMRRRQELRALAIFLLLWTFMMRERLDLLYSNYLMPLWYIALVLLVREVFITNRKAGKAILFGLVVLYAGTVPGALRYTWSFAYPVSTPAGLLWANQQAQAAALGQLYRAAGELTPPGSKTFAWPFASSFYCLSRTSNPSRADFLVSGWQSTEQARAVARSLEGVTYLYQFPLDPALLEDYPNLDPATFEQQNRDFADIVSKGFEPFAQAGSAVLYRRVRNP